MANKFWVQGTGSWSDDDNHWATSSGGSPGNGNLPTSSDDVFFDENSGFGGGGQITIDVLLPEIHDFTSSTGHSFTINKASGYTYLRIYGSLVSESGLTFGSGARIDFRSVSSEVIDTNGGSLQFVLFTGAGGWELQGDLVLGDYFYIEKGTFDANDFDVSADEFYFYGGTGYEPVINMGSGTWTVGGVGWTVYDDAIAKITLNAEGSTIQFSEPYCVFDVIGSPTFNNIEYIGGTVSRISGNITVNNLTFSGDLEGGDPPEYYIEGGTTITIGGDLSFTGEVGKVYYLYGENGSGPEYQCILSKAGGFVECNCIKLKSCSATGGARWYAGENSINNGNNSGWIFKKRKYQLPARK